MKFHCRPKNHSPVPVVVQVEDTTTNMNTKKWHKGSCR